MASETPTPLAPGKTIGQRPRSRLTAQSPARTLSSCHYPARPRSRKIIAVAALLSAAVHAGFFLGPAKKQKPPVEKEVPTLSIAIVMPDVRDLEEPERETREVNDAASSSDLAMPAPSQVELVLAPQVGDFVQQIDFDALIDRSVLGQDKNWVIPDTIRRTGGIKSIGDIFNLADLQRAPEPIFQPAPIYPSTMKRDALTASVNVEFIVDTNGNVVNAAVVESSHSGFNDAAVSGVMKWKFRPGMRGGRKVNARMRVPIVFHFVESGG